MRYWDALEKVLSVFQCPRTRSVVSMGFQSPDLPSPIVDALKKNLRKVLIKFGVLSVVEPMTKFRYNLEKILRNLEVLYMCWI